MGDVEQSREERESGKKPGGWMPTAQGTSSLWADKEKERSVLYCKSSGWVGRTDPWSLWREAKRRNSPKEVSPGHCIWWS